MAVDTVNNQFTNMMAGRSNKNTATSRAGGTAEEDDGITVNTGKNSDSLDVDAFMALLAAQLSNQDMMNPMKDTEFMSQLAQFTTLEVTEQLLEVNTAMLAINNQAHASSLLGKNVTVARMVKGEDGESKLERKDGTVTGVGFFGGRPVIYLGEEPYDMQEVMAVGTLPKTPESSGITSASSAGNAHNEGGSYEMRGWDFSGTVATIGATGNHDGEINIALKDASGNAVAGVAVTVKPGQTAAEIKAKVVEEINTSAALKDAKGASLYKAEIDEATGALVATAKNATTGTYSMIEASIENVAGDITGLNITAAKNADGTTRFQTGSDHTTGGKGASATLDFAKTVVGDTFKINGKVYEIIQDDSKPSTADAKGIKYQADREAMVKDILERTGSTYSVTGNDAAHPENAENYMISSDGTKIIIASQNIPSGQAGAPPSTPPVFEVGSVKKDDTEEA